jgi:hypothetical protein
VVAYTYSRVAALNFNTTPPTVARSATGSVYAIADTTFTTPLTITMVVGGSTTITISSDANGFFPDFTVNDRTSVVWKQASSSFTTVLTTSDPVPGPQGAAGTPGATGAQGPRGDLATWQTATFYPLNQVIANPSGDLVKVTTAHTSGASYDATKFGYVVPPGLDTATLNATYAPVAGSANYATPAAVTAAVAPKLDASQKGAASGVASLDSGTKVPVAQIPDLSGSYVTILKANFDGTDETATLQAAVTAAAGGVLVMPANKTIKSTKITIPAAGITIRGLGKGSTFDYIDGGTSSECLFEAISVTGFAVEDCTIKASNATGRTSVWGLIRARLTTGFYVRRVTFGKSSSCAIWTSSTTEFAIMDIDIDGTYADGIHLSRGTSKGTVARIRAKNLGDDIIGLNSYINDGATYYDQMTNITVTDIKGYNIGTGRGVAVNGCVDVRISDVMVDGVAQAAVIVATDANTFTSNTNVSIDGVVAHNTGQNVPGGGTSGAVYMTSTNGGTISRVVGGAVTLTSTAIGVSWDERPDGNSLTTGQEVFSRELLTSTKSLTSGALFLSYFTARKSETITQLRSYSSTPAAAATPTLVRFGLYTVASNGDLTLVASTPNDTALYATASTAYTKALTAGYALVKGVRYVFGVLVVSSFTVPTVTAAPAITALDSTTQSPRMVGVVTAQTDLPSTIASGSIGTTGQRIFAALLP